MPDDPNPQSPSRRAALSGLKARDLLAAALAGESSAEVPAVPGYQLRGLIGRGGMGAVYEAWQESLGREVAVKVLAPESFRDGGMFDRLEREAKAMARVAHANIVHIHDFIRLENGGAAIVMERVKGRNLRSLLGANPTGLPMDVVSRLAPQMVAALSAAHAAGVVHRDIKPENVLVTDDSQQAKLTDFGLALELDEVSTRLTQKGMTVGTPAYMSPEQLAGSTVDTRADLFSLGVVLYEMSTGSWPQGSFAPPHEVRPDIPRAFSDLVMRCLKPSASERFSSADAVLQALSAPAIEPKSISRRAAFAVATATVAAGVFWWRRRDDEWQNLLTDIQLPAVPSRGDWQRVEGVLESRNQEGAAVLGVPVNGLGDEYELRWKFARLSGSKAVAVFFRTSRGVGTFELDAWEQPGLAGVQMIDETDLRRSGSFQHTVQNGVVNEFILRVVPGSIHISSGGKELSHYQIGSRRLDVVSPWQWTEEWRGVSLAIGSWSSPTRFQELSLRRA